MNRTDFCISFLLTSIFFVVFQTQASYAALSCTLTTACSGTAVLRLSGTSNAQAEVPGNSNYPQILCCTGVSGLGTNCSGNYGTVLKLSGTSNAHVTENTGSYGTLACLSSATDAVSIGYQDTSCAGYDTALVSISSSDNAHVASSTIYTRKVCASVGSPTLSFEIDTSSASFGTLSPGGGVSVATNTLSAKTNNQNGFSIFVSRDDTDTTLDLSTDSSKNILDKLEWIAPSATTTVGNSTASTTDTARLQFRVRTQGTDAPNFAPTWWGPNDTTASALFGGFPSTTQKIINRGVSADATTTAVMLYNLAVPITQPDGNYTGSITYTITANP